MFHAIFKASPSLLGMQFVSFLGVKIYRVSTIYYRQLLNRSDSTHHTSASIYSVEYLPTHFIYSCWLSLIWIGRVGGQKYPHLKTRIQLRTIVQYTLYNTKQFPLLVIWTLIYGSGVLVFGVILTLLSLWFMLIYFVTALLLVIFHDIFLVLVWSLSQT